MWRASQRREEKGEREREREEEGGRGKEGVEGEEEKCHDIPDLVEERIQ